MLYNQNVVNAQQTSFFFKVLQNHEVCWSGGGTSSSAYLSPLFYQRTEWEFVREGPSVVSFTQSKIELCNVSCVIAGRGMIVFAPGVLGGHYVSSCSYLLQPDCVGVKEQDLIERSHHDSSSLILQAAVTHKQPRLGSSLSILYFIFERMKLNERGRQKSGTSEKKAAAPLPIPVDSQSWWTFFLLIRWLIFHSQVNGLFTCKWALKPKCFSPHWLWWKKKRGRED